MWVRPHNNSVISASRNPIATDAGALSAFQTPATPEVPVRAVVTLAANGTTMLAPVNILSVRAAFALILVSRRLLGSSRAPLARICAADNILSILRFFQNPVR